MKERVWFSGGQGRRRPAKGKEGDIRAKQGGACKKGNLNNRGRLERKKRLETRVKKAIKKTEGKGQLSKRFT